MHFHRYFLVWAIDNKSDFKHFQCYQVTVRHITVLFLSCFGGWYTLCPIWHIVPIICVIVQCILWNIQIGMINIVSFGTHMYRVGLSLQWRHNGHDIVSNNQPHDCLLHHLFRRRSKKKSKLRVTGLCAGNSPGTGEFPEQMASYAENVSIWWRHHGFYNLKGRFTGPVYPAVVIVKETGWEQTLPTTRNLGNIGYNSWNIRYGTIMMSCHGNVFRIIGPLKGDPPVTGWLPHKGPVLRSLGCFLVVILNMLCNK